MILLLAAGVTAGSIYIAKGGEETAQEIKSYMDGFFASFAESRNNMAVFRNSLASNLISAAIIFCMGFFRLGCIGTGALLVKKGFAAGFTAAAFFKFYGADGMLIMLSTMPTVIITIPALLILSAGSVSFSLRNDKKEKKLIFSYIFFFILMLSIFCAASLTEGFLTTTFINWSIPKVN
jgi:stage II sporulation protein M